MILDILHKDGHAFKRQSDGKFRGCCPFCSGEGFVVSTEANRYYCHYCNKKGDSVQYLQDFHLISFKQAMDLLEKTLSSTVTKKTKKVGDILSDMPLFQNKCKALVDYAHEQLLQNKEALAWIKENRGIEIETIKHFKIGWLSQGYWRDKKDFGIKSGEGNKEKFYIPSSLVISHGNDGVLFRRFNDHDKWRQIPKSTDTPRIICGKPETIGIIVESDLDGYLLHQDVKRDLTIVVLGGAGKTGNDQLFEALRMCPIVIILLDNDNSGRKNSVRWGDELENSFRVVIPKRYGKDVTDLKMVGEDLNQFISKAMELYIETLGRPKTEKLSHFDYQGSLF